MTHKVKLFQKLSFLAFLVFISLYAEPVAADGGNNEFFLIRWFKFIFNCFCNSFKWLFGIAEKPTTKKPTTTKPTTTKPSVADKTTTNAPITTKKPTCALKVIDRRFISNRLEQIYLSIENLGHVLLKLLNYDKNILLSPFEIQTGILTASVLFQPSYPNEILKALYIDEFSIEEVRLTYKDILALYIKETNFMINKIYYKEDLSLKKNLNLIVGRLLSQTAEPIDFVKSGITPINTWVTSETDNIIKNFMGSTTFNSDDSVVVVNGMIFRKKWKQQFKRSATQEMFFYANETKRKVNMMKMTGEFKQGFFHQLSADVLEIPLEDNYSVLVFLFENLAVLSYFVEKLKYCRFSDVYRCMEPKNITIGFPKFQAESEVDLSDKLNKLYTRRMFYKNAEYVDDIFQPHQKVYISKFLHKSVIEFTESGTSSDILYTGGKDVTHSDTEFILNKPFAYFILHSHNDVINTILAGVATEIGEIV